MLFGLIELFHTLDSYNRDGDYILYRQKDLRKMLTITTLSTVGFVMIFHIFESLLVPGINGLLLIVRSVACAVFLLNLGLALLSKTHTAVRFFTYSGFLLCAFFASFQSAVSGGFQSPYSFTICMIVIAWFIFVPVSYYKQILHALVFIAQYLLILSLTNSASILDSATSFLLICVLGIFFIGVLISIISNFSTARIYYNQLALEDSESKYRNLVEHATNGITITYEGKFLFSNQTFKELMGYADEELSIRTIFDLIAEEDKEKVREIHARRMKGDQFNAVYRINAITKSGQRLPLELNSTTIEYNGKPSAFILVRDFSEQESAQKALIESEERYRTIFNMAGDAILLMRYVTGEVVDVNDAACKLYGYTREEFLQLSNPDISGEPEASMQILRDNKGYVYIPERFHKRKDGSILNVEVMGNVFRLNGEDLAISVIHDLTEKKKLEQELEKSYEVLEKNYSHTLEQMQTYFAELQAKKSELLRLQKENLQSQFDALKNQVNPHFLFNSLNILSSLISVNTELAEEFTGNLSKIYRYILEHKSDDMVSISSELDFLQAYCFLVNIRFEGKLKFNIHIAEDCLQRKVPQLAIQILIENAIKHNTFSVKSPLIIDIFTDDEQYLHIENNYQRRENSIESTGVGLANIANRYSFFTDKETSFGVVEGKFIARIPML